MKVNVIFKKIFTIFLFIVISTNCICYGISKEPDITAESAFLIEKNTGKVLYSKNETKKMYPASTTKILTAILTIENTNLDDIVTVPYEAISSIPSGYQIANLQAGEQLTVRQLLQMLLTYSANDVANTLAYHVSGSIEGFSNLMNNKFLELGLNNSHFDNPSGMHSENHYTTAYDLAMLMKYCIENSSFRDFASLSSCKIEATNKSSERTFTTTNELLIQNNKYYYKYAIAGKTGYTTQAKNCLVSVAIKDNLELISVVLGVGLYPNNQSGRFLETISLFDYGYDNYTIRKLREKNAIATQIKVPNGTKETRDVNLLVSDDINAIVDQKDLETEFSPDIKINENISAPIIQGDTLGKIIYNIDGITYSSDLVASHDVERSNYMQLIFSILLIGIILFILHRILFDNKNRNKKSRNKNNHSRRYR